MFRRYDTDVPDSLVCENSFVGRTPVQGEVPRLSAARYLLPDPRWDVRSDVIAAYGKAWELTFRHLCAPTRCNGFIDAAFNDHIFMGDSVFMHFFGWYGVRVFDFHRTLDHFYAKQHPNGYICREIDEATGRDLYGEHDPSSTGPNLFPWSEWEHYRWTGDRSQLRAVFPVLWALFRWFDTWRTWHDDSCFTTGYGSGMDNQPRSPDPSFDPWRHHGHLSGIDATAAQHAFAVRMLSAMAVVLGRRSAAALHRTARLTAQLINRTMWCEKDRFYYDRDGTLTRLKTVGAYWTLLTGTVPRTRSQTFITHLDDPRIFKRRHRVPSLPANHPMYRSNGGYRLGGVWPSTYMVLRGLNAVGNPLLAHEIACNHVDNVVTVFRRTGTLWENYAPERIAPGTPAKGDFVGWTGIVPIAVLLGVRVRHPSRCTHTHFALGYPTHGRTRGSAISVRHARGRFTLLRRAPRCARAAAH